MISLTLVNLALAAAPVERYALLVGHNDGGVGRPTLRYAHADAASMASVLVELGGVAPNHDLILYDPSRNQLLTALANLRTKLSQQQNAELVFYYSGHSDEVGLMLGSERLEYTELRAQLDQMPARIRIGILDSCASGSLILTKGGTPAPAFLRDESANVGGSAYLTSSSATEVAQEAERIGGSFFTHYLASGLRGAADATGDRRVTLQEAYAYASAETLAQTARTEHGPQHANHLYNTSGTGELILTDLTLTNASLVLAASIEGHALVYDQDGSLVVEITKVGGRDIELGLAEGKYTVALVQGNRYGEVKVTLSVGTSNLVELTEIAWQPLERAVARGEAPALATISPVYGPIPNRWPRISVLPFVPAASQPGADTLLFSLIADVSPELHGVAFAFAGHTTTGRASGWQSTLAYTTAGELHGLQTSVGFNLATRDVRGVQATAGANVAGGLDGAQLSAGVNVVSGGGAGLQGTAGVNVVGADFIGAQLSAVNVVGGSFRGVQGAYGANVVGGAMNGVQLAAGWNHLTRPSKGAQISAGLNTATGSLAGAQIGIVNVGAHVDGAQIGVVNIAGEVDGAQFGVVNVARDVSGPSIGVLSFIANGRHDLLLFSSESDVLNTELKLGSRSVHSILGFGAGLQHGYVSYGIGGHIPAGPLWVDLDLLGQSYVPVGLETIGQEAAIDAFQSPSTPVVRARATVGLQVLEELAPFVGLSMATRIPIDAPLVDVVPDQLSSGKTVIAWPGFVAGVQF